MARDAKNPAKKRGAKKIVFDPQTGHILPSLEGYIIRRFGEEVFLFGKLHYAYRVDVKASTCTCPRFIFSSYLKGQAGVCMHLQCAVSLRRNAVQ